MGKERINWVDYAKGICILLVVMMHSVLDYEKMVGLTGWMNFAVDFAQPFRMPDFFLIAGLFLSQSLFGRAREYWDRKLVHFAYFYLLWLAIQTAIFEANLLMTDPAQVAWIYVQAIVIPKSSLWFIHALAVFYAVTRLVRHVPKLWVFGVAAGLQCLHSAGLVETGWSVTNRFAEWYVFFFAGYAGAPIAFQFAAYVRKNMLLALTGLVWWALANAVFVALGLWDLPIVQLSFGLVGAFAVIAIAALLEEKDWLKPLKYIGQHSIVIYLTFFLPMKALQAALAKTGIVPDVGLATFIVWTGASLSPLVFHWMIQRTPLIALYERPRWARLSPPRSVTTTKSIA